MTGHGLKDPATALADAPEPVVLATDGDAVGSIAHALGLR